MVRRLSIALAISLWCMLSIPSANANPLDSLNFNSLKNGRQVGTFYAGESSNSGVANLGVTFSFKFYGLQSDSHGGEAFSQDVTVTPIIFVKGTSDSPVASFMNVAGVGCFFAYHCHGSDGGLRFSGTAESDTFSGPANTMGLTDMTFGNTRTAIPEPSSIYLLAIGIAACCAQGLRRFLKKSR